MAHGTECCTNRTSVTDKLNTANSTAATANTPTRAARVDVGRSSRAVLFSANGHRACPRADTAMHTPPALFKEVTRLRQHLECFSPSGYRQGMCLAGLFQRLQDGF